MDTPAYIIYQVSDDRTEYIYLHTGGDIAGETLRSNYMAPYRVQELLDLGNLYSLGCYTDCPPGHSLETPADHHCVSFNRDRGLALVPDLHTKYVVTDPSDIDDDVMWSYVYTPAQGWFTYRNGQPA